MPLLTRKRLILLESEGTYGTDPTPTGSDAVLVRDLNITPLQSDVVSRDLVRPYLGASEQLLANTRVECTFSVELAGSGTAGTAPRYGKALLACGMSETVVAVTSVTYAPVSSAFGSCTIYYNIDGVLHKVTGARGTFTINGAVGEIPTIDFTFTGIYNTPTDTALPSVTYGDQATPLVFKAGNTTGFELLSYAGCLQSVSFDVGNTLVYRELVGCTKEVLLTDRASSGSVTLEAVTMATKNYFTAALTDGSLGNLLFQHGQTAGNIVDFASTRVDIGDVSYSDQDGIHMLNIPYTCVPTTAGNDEFSLVYT
jgi:hypothetical protein